MRFYEFEAKQLLAKAGIATCPHPESLASRCDLCDRPSPAERERGWG